MDLDLYVSQAFNERIMKERKDRYICFHNLDDLYVSFEHHDQLKNRITIRDLISKHALKGTP